VGVSPENVSHALPTDTNNATLFTPAVDEKVEGFVNVCNVSDPAEPATATVFIDPSGLTYDATTKVQNNVDIIPGIPAERFGPYTLVGPTARIGVRSSVGSTLNFTFSKLVQT
jgi:hypothetical protein